MSGKFDFLHEDKHQSLPQTGCIAFTGQARHTQLTQNNKFAIRLQYLKKDGREDVYFLHADKHESILQVDTIDQNKFTISLQYLKKEVRVEVDFLCRLASQLFIN